MASIEDDRQESEVPELAVKALTAAHRRALLAGHALVLVQNGKLVRVDASGPKVLKQLPLRGKVNVRKKSVKS